MNLHSIETTPVLIKKVQNEFDRLSANTYQIFRSEGRWVYTNNNYPDDPPVWLSDSDAAYWGHEYDTRAARAERLLEAG
jgi:hypothetical protein